MKTENENRRGAVIAGALAAVLLVCAAVVLIVVTGSGGQPQARARQYTRAEACLLTDPRGITGPLAATVWAGMEDASLATHAKVSYLSVNGPKTASAAVPYANSLVVRHCGVILAAGAPQNGALAQVAARNPKTYFVLAGNNAALMTGNLQTVSPGPGLRGRVAHTVEQLTSG